MLTVAIATYGSGAAAQPGPPGQTPLLPRSAPSPVVRAPERGYGGLGVIVGSSGTWLFGAWLLELGARIPTSAPVALRVRGFTSLVGGTTESDWGGDFSRHGGGAEARRCTQSGFACGFVGFDVGYQKLTMYDHGDRFVGERSGPFVAPRVGLDAGSRVRIRVGVEIVRHKTHHDPARWDATGNFALGLVYQR